MGEEAGRKSPLRHANTIALLAAILAVSLAPAIALRFFPREASASMLAPISGAIASVTGFSSESVAAVLIVTMFVLTTVTASALVLVLARVLFRPVRGSS
jgi:CBS-domain-containing membrane protein